MRWRAACNGEERRTGVEGYRAAANLDPAVHVRLGRDFELNDRPAELEDLAPALRSIHRHQAGREAHKDNCRVGEREG